MKPKRYLYVWLLPLLWSVCSLLSYYYFPGTDKFMWLVGSLAGFWWVLFVRSVVEFGAWWIPYVTVLCGAFVMALPGFCLDRYRLNLKVFLAVWWLPFLAVTTQLVMRNGSVAEAVAKHGSFVSFICAGFNLSLIATALLAIAWVYIGSMLHQTPKSRTDLSGKE
ncbi:hypothetical protein GX645_03915 [Candidatus Sumerlaeota bacterium]|nr:hypothetical protein [Candidatus Sumerlaeota bacterium]